ncbi:hypothetical protein B6U74_06935 [Candidatus Bathyarchaeota archaeon ex4484_205]|nr:MAG: hypothetical protein B6U74_06935 [Candidatus Bathyarchaeota archaeon ex4484_205]
MSNPSGLFLRRVIIFLWTSENSLSISPSVTITDLPLSEEHREQSLGLLLENLHSFHVFSQWLHQ